MHEDQGLIEVELSDPNVHKLQFDLFKDEFKGMLVEKLGDNQFKLKVKIVERKDDDSPMNRLYTDQDKLNYLIETYPAIAKLKDTFKLEVGNFG